MLRPLRLALPSLLAALASAAPALAQVNTEAMRSDLDTRQRYLALQASVAGHTGNTEGVVASGSAFAGAMVGPHLVFLKLQGDYAEFSGKPSITKAFAHGRYNLHLLPFLYAEFFAQVEQNRFQRLSLRQLDGAGVRFGILQQKRIRLFYGTAWMLDYEKLDGQFVFGGGPAWIAQRWSNYVSASFRVTGPVRLSDTLYAQPRFNGFSDVRVYNDASLVIDIDKRFSVKIDCEVHHNHTPPLHVRPTDVDTTTSLVLTL